MFLKIEEIEKKFRLTLKDVEWHSCILSIFNGNIPEAESEELKNSEVLKREIS